MIKEKFLYKSPKTIEEAIAVLAEKKEGSTILGGGTWVVPEMTSWKRNPEQIVDLRHMNLATVKKEGEDFVLGAMVTYSQILESTSLIENVKLLGIVSKGITGGAQIRNFGTIGGSAVYANPGSDMPAALVTLSARLSLVSEDGKREVPAEEFFLDAFKTAIQPGEILTEISIPSFDSKQKFGYYKLKFGESSWPIATGACLIKLDNEDKCQSVRLVLGGICAAPLLVDVTKILVDSPITKEKLAEVEQAVHDAVEQPWSDVLATADYRKSIASVVAKRALLDALR